jgi:transposase InsO family protein
MDLHQNARLTFRSREALALKIILERLTLNAAAAAFHVSRKTAAKWVRRYRTLGLPGLRDLSSRPLRSPRRTSSQRIAQVVALRRQLLPAYQIAQATQLSPATVSRILRRAHLNRWRHLHPAPPVVRYEHAAPGDLLHLDIKGMTRYQQVSMRGDGRRRGRPQFAGWQALHVAIDDHSHLAFSRMLPNQQAETAIAFLRAAVAFYAQHGIPIRRLLTDNGSYYRSRHFRAACLQLGIQHRFTRPYTPRTNASFKLPCANGPTFATISAPRSAISSSRPGSSITTSTVPMIVSATLRPSAGLRWVQRLDGSHPPPVLAAPARSKSPSLSRSWGDLGHHIDQAFLDLVGDV